MLPFDLAQFDSPTSSTGGASTIDTLETIAMLYLDKPGLEKDASALLLSRLYTRYVLVVLYMFIRRIC